MIRFSPRPVVTPLDRLGNWVASIRSPAIVKDVWSLVNGTAENVARLPTIVEAALPLNVRVAFDEVIGALETIVTS